MHNVLMRHRHHIIFYKHTISFAFHSFLRPLNPSAAAAPRSEGEGRAVVCMRTTFQRGRTSTDMHGAHARTYTHTRTGPAAGAPAAGAYVYKNAIDI